MQGKQQKGELNNNLTSWLKQRRKYNAADGVSIGFMSLVLKGSLY